MDLSLKELEAIVYAILYPLHEAGIEIYHRDHIIRPIKGPTTYSFAFQLVDPYKITDAISSKMKAAIEAFGVI